MSRFILRSVVFLLPLIGAAVAQQQPGPPMPQPRISAIFPMGGKAGTSFEVTVSGTDLDEPSALLFSDPGFRAEMISQPLPAPDPKAKGTTGGSMKNRTGPLTSVKFKVSLASNLTPGHYDVRLVTKSGVSNPRAIVVSDQNEVLESDKPHNDVPEAQRIEMGSVVNATISSQVDVDYYVVPAKAGQRFIVHAAASSIDSKARPLLELYDASGRKVAQNRNYAENDAVLDWTPQTDGDFYIRVAEFAYQPATADYFYRLRVSTAPWIDAVYPPAVPPGKPTQVTVIGRNLPGGTPWNGQKLESLTVTVTPPANAVGRMAYTGYVSPAMSLQDAFNFSIRGPGGESNIVPIFLAQNPVVLESPSDNNTPENAQPITAPCEVAGRIESKHDKDWYVFEAKKGDTFTIELHADRIGSQMDLYYIVKNAANMGNVMEEQDDDPDPLHPITFYNRTGDPAAVRFVAPSDNKFLIFVGSRESGVSYGIRQAYRLVVGRVQPDFRAVVMPKSRDLPSCTVIGQSAHVALDLFIDRRGGFVDPVTVTLENLPPGVSAKPVNIGAGVRWGTVVLTSNDSAAEFQGAFTVKCTATIDGQPVTREARSASITWGLGQQQQTSPVISRLDRQAVLAVRTQKASFHINVDLNKATVRTRNSDGKEVVTKFESPLFVRPGDKITLPILASWQNSEARPNPINLFIEPYQQGSQNAPIGVSGGGGGNNQNPAGTIAKDKNDSTMTLDVRSQANPGHYAIVIRGETQIPRPGGNTSGSGNNQNRNLTASSFTLPIEVIVLPTSLARVSAAPVNVKPGGSAEIVVRVERQGNYTGEFAVTATIPKDLKGISIPNAVIPAGKDEARLTVTLDPGVKIGNLQGLNVVVEGKAYGRQTIRNEARLQITVTK